MMDSIDIVKRNEECTITFADNGYVLSLGGRNAEDDWKDYKFVFSSFSDLIDAVALYGHLEKA